MQAEMEILGRMSTMPKLAIIEIGGFDALIGLQWLKEHKAVVHCHEDKVVFPTHREILIKDFEVQHITQPSLAPLSRHLPRHIALHYVNPHLPVSSSSYTPGAFFKPT